jgi:hypothetical protein
LGVFATQGSPLAHGGSYVQLRNPGSKEDRSLRGIIKWRQVMVDVRGVVDGTVNIKTWV